MKLAKTTIVLFLILFSFSVSSLSITESTVPNQEPLCGIVAQAGLASDMVNAGDDCSALGMDSEKLKCVGTIPRCFDEIIESQAMKNQRLIQGLVAVFPYYLVFLLLFLIVPAVLLYFSKNLLVKKILGIKLVITIASLMFSFIDSFIVISNIGSLVIVQIAISGFLYFTLRKIKENTKLKTATLIVIIAELLIIPIVISASLFLIP